MEVLHDSSSGHSSKVSLTGARFQIECLQLLGKNTSHILRQTKPAEILNNFFGNTEQKRWKYLGFTGKIVKCFGDVL